MAATKKKAKTRRRAEGGGRKIRGRLTAAQLGKARGKPAAAVQKCIDCKRVLRCPEADELGCSIPPNTLSRMAKAQSGTLSPAAHWRGWRDEEAFEKIEGPEPSTALIVPAKNGQAVTLAPKLNVNERKRLAGLERTIAANLQSFHDLGCAMIEIRDRKLYREGFPTFESYCKARWDFGRQYAYRLIDSAKVVDDLSPIGDKKLPLPLNESQARPLAKVDPDQRVEVWREVLKRADREAGGRVTTALVEETAKEWITPGDVLDEEKERKAAERKTRGAAQTPRDCVPGEAADSDDIPRDDFGKDDAALSKVRRFIAQVSRQFDGDAGLQRALFTCLLNAANAIATEFDFPVVLSPVNRVSDGALHGVSAPRKAK